MSRRFVLSVLSLLVASCSSFSASDPDAALDSVITDGPPIDTTAPRCDRTKPFGAPLLVPSLNTAGRDFQAVLADDLTMYFASDRGGSVDLFTATRTSTSQTFGNPQPISGFATTAAETSPALTSDALTLAYAYTPVNGASADIYLTTRAPATPFAAGSAIPGLNAAEDDGDPTLTGDGAQLFFDSTRPGTGGYDLWVSRKQGATYGTPILVSELSSPEYDAHPRITADGLTIYFSSMRADASAAGAADVWKATRTSASGLFNTPVLVPELNTAANESPTWISPDDCVIYLQSDRPGGLGGQDIWAAVKPQ